MPIARGAAIAALLAASAIIPTNEKFDGAFRNVRIEVRPTDNRKLTVITRPGYYAPKPKT